MARRRRTTKYKLPGLRQYIDQVSRVTSAKGAEEIVMDLKKKGPYFSGEFEENWVVVTGDRRIPADKKSSLTQAEKWQSWESGELPFSRRVTPVDIPTLSKGQPPEYTIGNRMEYRNIALDLVPGRFSPGRNNTAPKDWYISYIQGGGLQNALRRATGKASDDPRVKGFKAGR